MIAVKLDVTKVDKNRLFVGKNGAKYLDLILMETPNDKYGNDFLVKQSVSKAEREAGVKLPILGNAKFMGQGAKPAPATTTQDAPSESGGVPF